MRSLEFDILSNFQLELFFEKLVYYLMYIFGTTDGLRDTEETQIFEPVVYFLIQ